jgi:hypothetical protein
LQEPAVSHFRPKRPAFTGTKTATLLAQAGALEPPLGQSREGVSQRPGRARLKKALSSWAAPPLPFPIDGDIPRSGLCAHALCWAFPVPEEIQSVLLYPGN